MTTWTPQPPAGKQFVTRYMTAPTVTYTQATVTYAVAATTWTPA